MAIVNFLNSDLELFYKEGIVTFEQALVIDITDILTALDAIDNEETLLKVVKDNFSGHLYEEPNKWCISVTINGVEAVGSIIFAYQQPDIIDVDYIYHR